MTNPTTPAQVDIEELEALAKACPDDNYLGYCGGCQRTIGDCACSARYQFRYAATKGAILALIAEVRGHREKSDKCPPSST